MQKLFVAVIFFVSSQASAQLEFVPSRQILMSGLNCQELQTHAQAIIDWTKYLTNTSYEAPECFCSAKSCHIDVAPISPYFVKELTVFESGFSPSSAFSGPNCFNAALVSTHSLPQITYTHPYEMTAVLGSSLCKEVLLDDELRPGDVLAVRDQSQNFFEVHAGIYINDVLSFSKYGEVSLMPYTYGLNVDRSYGVNDERCRRVQGLPKEGEPCYEKPFVNFFRCQPLYLFISEILKQPDGLHPGAQKVYARVSSLDSTISAIAYKGRAVNESQLKDLQLELVELYEATGGLVQSAELSDGNRELVNLMRFRIYSLYDQTRIVAKTLKFADLVQPALGASPINPF